MSDYFEVPLTEAGMPFVKIGEATLWAKDGLVVLGNAAFSRFAKITDHRFAGWVANRGDDNVLVLTTPFETHRFIYKDGIPCWFQQVPDLSADVPWYLVGKYRECIREKGFLLGLLSFPFAVVAWLAAKIVPILATATMALASLLVFVFPACCLVLFLINWAGQLLGIELFGSHFQ